MNGRTAQQVDYKPDVHMNRYIDIPELNARAPHLPERQNHEQNIKLKLQEANHPRLNG